MSRKSRVNIQKNKHLPIFYSTAQLLKQISPHNRNFSKIFLSGRYMTHSTWSLYWKSERRKKVVSKLFTIRAFFKYYIFLKNFYLYIYIYILNNNKNKFPF